MKYLTLILQGDQAWCGQASKHCRPTETFPTKSGVLGLIFNACSWLDYTSERLQDFQKSPLTIFQLSNLNYHTDFAIMQSYALLEAHSKNGKIFKKGYLKTATFGAILGVPDKYAEDIVLSLYHPRVLLFLGRANCRPEGPVLYGCSSDPDSAYRLLQQYMKEHTLSLKAVVEDMHIIETGLPQKRTELVHDVPVRFGLKENPLYTWRRIFHY